MKNKIEELRKFVIEQLQDYDEYREASPEGYADGITEKAVKLFRQPDVIKSVCDCTDSKKLVEYSDTPICKWCGKDIKQTVL